MDELDNLATRPAAMIQVATTAACLNRYMLIEGIVEIGDQVDCDACPEQHAVLDLVEIGVADVVTVPALTVPALTVGAAGARR